MIHVTSDATGGMSFTRESGLLCLSEEDRGDACIRLTRDAAIELARELIAFADDEEGRAREMIAFA